MVDIKENVIKKKKISLKSILKDFIKYYKENLKVKHIVCFIIMVIIFALSLNLFYTNLNNQEAKEIITESVKGGPFISSLGEKVFLAFIIVFAGFTPYLYISVIGVFCGYSLANNIIISYILNGSTTSFVFMIIGGVIQLIGFSLCVATGINYCRISTKRRKFSSNTTYGLNDIKSTFYNLKNDKEGMKKVEESNRKKFEEKKKYNVKVPYLTFIVSFIISIIFVLVGMVI